MARHVCNRFIVEAEPNQEVMPIKLPLLPALKNVSICYNDGRFSYFLPPPDDCQDDYNEPGICSLIKPSCVALLYIQIAIDQFEKG